MCTAHLTKVYLVDWGKELCVTKVKLNDQLLFSPFPTWFYEESTFEAAPYSCTFIGQPQETQQREKIDEIEQTWSLDITEKQMRKQAKRFRKLEKKELLENS